MEAIKEIVLMELFSGIGGFSKGIEQAGFTIKNHYFSEIDKHAIANYKYNFKNAEYIGSVNDVQRGSLERPHIITFGSPCQDFSLAGKQLGLNGERSVLILEAIRIIREFRPNVFIWENVKGAFSSNNGADFWAIIAAFANIGGYRLEWQLLNTSWFLPQNRERIYLIGHLAGGSEPGVFPIGENDFMAHQTFTKKRNRNEVANTLSSAEYKLNLETNYVIKSNTKKGFEEVTENDSINFSVPSSKTRRGRVGKGVAQTLDTQCNIGVIANSKLLEKEYSKGNSQGNRVYDTSGISVTLSSQGGGGGAKTGLYEVRPVLTPNRSEKRQNGRRFKEDGDPAFTLGCQDQHGVMINDKHIRRLTEIECERLQGFSDDWTKFGLYTNKNGIEQIKEIPKTQRYKLCGNAVTVDVVECCAKKLFLSKL